MVLISHETTTTIGLLFKQERARHRQLCKLNHQIVQRLIIRAIQALFWVTFHIRYSFIMLSCCNVFVQGIANGTITSIQFLDHTFNLLAKTSFVEVQSEDILTTV